MQLELVTGKTFLDSSRMGHLYRSLIEFRKTYFNQVVNTVGTFWSRIIQSSAVSLATFSL